MTEREIEEWNKKIEQFINQTFKLLCYLAFIGSAYIVGRVTWDFWIRRVIWE